MKTSGTGKFKSTGAKIVMGLVLAAIFGGMNVVAANADDDHGREGRHESRRYENRGHGRDHDRGRHGGRREYRRYGYVEPVYVAPAYVAPPVYYARPPAPGISIFLPTIHIR